MVLHVIFEEGGIPAWIGEESREGAEAIKGVDLMFLAQHRRTPDGDWVRRDPPPPPTEKEIAARDAIAAKEKEEQDVRNAEERAKPDAQRDPEYQDRNQKRLENSFVQLTKQWSPELEKAVLKLVIERELAYPAEKRAGIAEALMGKGVNKKAPTGAEIDKALAGLYQTTKLGDEAARLKLLSGAKEADLKTSKDPLIKLAVTLRSKVKDYEERDKRREGHPVALDQGNGRGVDRLRLLPEEAERAHKGLDRLGRGARKRGNIRKAGKERRRRLVDRDIGALGGEDRGEEELVRLRPVQFAVGVRVAGLQRGQDLGGACPLGIAGARELRFLAGRLRTCGRHERCGTVRGVSAAAERRIAPKRR